MERDRNRMVLMVGFGCLLLFPHLSKAEALEKQSELPPFILAYSGMTMPVVVGTAAMFTSSICPHFPSLLKG